MKFQPLLSLAFLIANALAVQVHYYAYYGNRGDFVFRTGSIRDHKAHGLVDGLHRWSDEHFTAYRSGPSVIVYNVRLASDEETARRLLGEMYSLVAHFAADG